jgi:hypothetical protein
MSKYTTVFCSRWQGGVMRDDMFASSASYFGILIGDGDEVVML